MDDFQRRALDIAQTSTYLTYLARQGKVINAIEYFSYNLEFDAIPALGSVTGNIQIQSDSDFVCVYMSGAQQLVGPSLDNAGVTQTPAGLLQLTDTGTGKTMFNQPVFGGLVLGQGGFPYLLPAPRTFAAQTAIKVDWTDLFNATAQTTNFYFVLQGARVYYN
jgi:hypothetical protein